MPVSSRHRFAASAKLNEPISLADLPDAFFRAIPKTDLHVHLDGSLRPSTLIELSKERGIELPSYDEAELMKILVKDRYNSLEEYLACFKYTIQVMQDSAALERVAYEFAVDEFSEGVRYFEVRFAPQLHASILDQDNLSIEQVIHSVNTGLRRACSEFNQKREEEIIENDNKSNLNNKKNSSNKDGDTNTVSTPQPPAYDYGIIVSALRSFDRSTSRYYSALCGVLAHLGKNSVYRPDTGGTATGTETVAGDVLLQSECDEYACMDAKRIASVVRDASQQGLKTKEKTIDTSPLRSSASGGVTEDSKLLVSRKRSSSSGSPVDRITSGESGSSSNSSRRNGEHGHGSAVKRPRAGSTCNSSGETTLQVKAEDEPHSDRVTSLASVALVHAAVYCRDEHNIPIVALDIAGAENGYKASLHREAFEYAQEQFLSKTVHAGEGFGPESIYQAVTDLHAQRIGHGFHLFSSELVMGEKNTLPQLGGAERYVERLLKHICDSRICLEVCLTSNLNTMPALNNSLRDHAFAKMMHHGVSVCINTDNRLISNTTTVQELQKAVDGFDLSPIQLRTIVINGFRRSFFRGSYLEKRAYVKSAADYFDYVAEKYGMSFSPDVEHSSAGGR